MRQASHVARPRSPALAGRMRLRTHSRFPRPYAHWSGAPGVTGRRRSSTNRQQKTETETGAIKINHTSHDSSRPHPFPGARPVNALSGTQQPLRRIGRGVQLKWGGGRCAHQAVEFDIFVDGDRHSVQILQSITFIITRAHKSTSSTASQRPHTLALSQRAPRHRSQSVATARCAPQRPPRSDDMRHDCSDSVSISCCADHHLATSTAAPTASITVAHPPRSSFSA